MIKVSGLCLVMFVFFASIVEAKVARSLVETEVISVRKEEVVRKSLVEAGLIQE